VIIYKIDRLARKLKDALEISEILEKNNVNLISLNEKFDTTTAFGRTAFQMICSFAELERNNIVERVKLGMEQRAKEGKFNGGKVLGYDSIDKNLVVNENEAVIVRKIFDYANQGLGYKAIARRLNEAGYRTKMNKPFNVFGIKTILHNPIYIGKIRYNQQKNWAEKRRKGRNLDYLLVDGSHEPIITTELWENVQQKLSQRSYKPSRSHQPYILSGLLKCPVCGHGMVPARSKGAGGKSYRYYVCGQFHNKGKAVCGSNMIRADVAEEQVLQELVKVASRPEILRQLVDKINEMRANSGSTIMKEKKAIIEELNKTSKHLQKIKQNILNDPELIAIFKDDLKEAHSRQEQLQKQLEALEAEMEKQNQKPVDYAALHNLLTQIQKALMQADADEQKALLRLMVESIHITKEAPRRVGRRITKINLHFDFTVDTLQKDSVILLSRIASIQQNDFIAPLEHTVLDSLNNITEEKLGDLMKSLNILPLAMIRFPPVDLHHPVDLLRQHEPHELVGQCHAAEAQPVLRASQYGRGEAGRPANHEHRVPAAVSAEPIQPLGKLLARPQLAVQRQRDHERVRLDQRQQPLAFALPRLRLLRRTQRLRHLLVRHLENVEFHIRPEPLRVLRDAVRQILLPDLPDRRDLDMHRPSAPDGHQPLFGRRRVEHIPVHMPDPVPVRGIGRVRRAPRQNGLVQRRLLLQMGDVPLDLLQLGQRLLLVLHHERVALRNRRIPPQAQIDVRLDVLDRHAGRLEAFHAVQPVDRLVVEQPGVVPVALQARHQPLVRVKTNRVLGKSRHPGRFLHRVHAPSLHTKKTAAPRLTSCNTKAVGLL
jgi:site-specific DNA recombinase